MLNIDLITRRRMALRLSRHDIARETGLSWQALLELEESDWRDGRHTLDALYAVAWALGLNPRPTCSTKRPANPAQTPTRRSSARHSPPTPTDCATTCSPAHSAGRSNASATGSQP
jgi:hypothetical protein